MPSIFAVLILILPLIFSPNGDFVSFAEAGKRRVQITDDLDDVVDDEEDESWKEWGKKSTPSLDLDPSDLSKMELPEIQSEIMKRNSGPVFGFVKLRLGVKRTQVIKYAFALRFIELESEMGLQFLACRLLVVGFFQLFFFLPPISQLISIRLKVM